MEKGETEHRGSEAATTPTECAPLANSYARSGPDELLSEATRREQRFVAEFLSSLLATDPAKARSFIDTYEAATDLVTAIDTLLVRHAEKCGFDRDEAFNRFVERPFRDAFNEVHHAAEKLASLYFLEHEKTRNETKFAAVVGGVKEFIDLMLQAQREGNISQDLLANDAFKLIAQNITAISLQDRGSDITTIVELDAHHLMEEELHGCMQLADALVEQGGAVSAMDKLLLHQSAVYHRVGLMIPPVLEAICQKGMQGDHLGIPMLTAQYLRSQYDAPQSVWSRVFPAHEFDLIHRAVLYQDKATEAPSDMVLQVTPVSDGATRKHNIEVIVRIAHKSDEQSDS
jgi:hypothetical protein